jgi:hypothetical protein
MALVGMSVVLLRAFKAGIGFESAIVAALAWMATLGLVGLVVAAIAEATVEEAVRVHMERELAAHSPK